MEPTPTRYPCEFCKEGHTGDIGGSYDRATCEADHLVKRLEILRRVRDSALETMNMAHDEIGRCERRLESVRNTGD